MQELSSLGLSPTVLQELLEHSKNESERLMQGKEIKKSQDDDPHFDEEASTSSHARRYNLSKVVYEVTGDSGRIEPQLRLWVDLPSSSGRSSPKTLDVREDSSATLTEVDTDEEEHRSSIEAEPSQSHMSLLWALQRQPWLTSGGDNEPERVETSTAKIMPVPSDK